MRIVIAEDSVLLREGLTRLLVDAGEEVVGTAGDAEEAMAVIEAERPDIVVIDASFISLKHVLPPALAIAARPLSLLALIKPQFEAERRHSKKGIIRDGTVHAAVCDDITAYVQTLGGDDVAVFPSSIAGGDGNIEFFIGARFV